MLKKELIQYYEAENFSGKKLFKVNYYALQKYSLH